MNLKDFRFEEGDVKIPAYELNRLQDFIEEQRKLEADFQELVKNEASILVMMRPKNNYRESHTEMVMTFKDGQEDYEKALDDLSKTEDINKALRLQKQELEDKINVLEREKAILSIRWWNVWAFPKEVRTQLRKLKSQLIQELSEVIDK